MRFRLPIPLLAALLAVACAGCGRGASARHDAATAPPLPHALPLELLADRAPDASLPPARTPPASLTLLRIAPDRAGVAPPPEPAPAEPPPAAAELERLPSDDQLRPPVPRTGTPLRLTGARGRWLELDVRVDEGGAVSDAEMAGGNADSALVRAAIAAARATRWYPAQRAGRPVAVWSRQRFEVGP